MKDSERIGIFVIKDRVFYYLEAGDDVLNKNFDRLRGTLLAKGKISYVVDRNETTYRTMSLAEAKEQGLDMKVIYYNKFVKQKFENQKQDDGPKKSWGS